MSRGVVFMPRGVAFMFFLPVVAECFGDTCLGSTCDENALLQVVATPRRTQSELTLLTTGLGVASCGYVPDGDLGYPSAQSPYITSNKYCVADVTIFKHSTNGCGACYRIRYTGEDELEQGARAGEADIMVVGSATLDHPPFACSVDAIEAITGVSTGRFPITYEEIDCATGSDGPVATFVKADDSRGRYAEFIFSNLVRPVARAEVRWGYSRKEMYRKETHHATWTVRPNGYICTYGDCGGDEVALNTTLTNGELVEFFCFIGKNALNGGWPLNTPITCAYKGPTPPWPMPPYPGDHALLQQGAERQRSGPYPHDLMTCSSGPVALTTACMTTGKYRSVSTSVRALYQQLPEVCEGLECPRGDWMGCVLRMAGHDFMDFDPFRGVGGSDGCVDFEDTDNRGLAPCLAGESGVSLLQAFQQHCTEVSLADFLVIAAEEVMRIGRENARALAPNEEVAEPDFEAAFRFGRSTRTSCPDNVALPDAERSCDAVEETFLQRMGLDWRGAAALMGTHTLGRARRNNSGYEGFWGATKHSMAFNNDYYASLVLKGWMPRKSYRYKRTRVDRRRPDRWLPAWMKHFDGFPDGERLEKAQWVRADAGGRNTALPEMMLNTDMCLLFKSPEPPGFGQTIVAADPSTHCCAWIPKGSIAVDEMAGGDRIYGRAAHSGMVQRMISRGSDVGQCGIPPHEIGHAQKEHGFCCAGWGRFWNCGLARPPAIRKQVADTGNPTLMQGPARQDVFNFADKEGVWLSELLRAWTLAVENGHGSGLRHLTETCQGE